MALERIGPDIERHIWHRGDVLLSLTPPSAERLERVVARESTAELTYSAVGATGRGERPPGYRYDTWNIEVGADDGSRFGRCARAVLAWEAQRGAGITVAPPHTVSPDLTFALVLPLPIGYAIATARIVQIVEDQTVAGFAYGTLPSHPEEGEEIFLVHRRDGRVSFEVTAFSRPRDPLARLGSPITRWLQVRTNRAYLQAIRRIANDRS
jgi:uncharacterized protein (UPF0548 family)